MGITLTSKAINSTYDSLLKLSDNDQLTGAFKVITDGLGNDTGISINNTNQVNIAGQLVVNSSITANSFVRSGGLSTQFLKADGSVDSNTYQNTNQKGIANGYAPLDSGAKISEAYLPDSIVGQLEYQGTWNANTDTPTLPSASTVKGHYYVTSVAGTYETIEYAIGDWIISNGTSWEKVDNTDAVTTVFGRIGAIVANSSDYSSFYHPLNGDLNANASTATTLQTARLINGTSFNGSANITTANWGTSRTITIGDTAKSLNGSTNVAWSRAELGITKTNIDALNIDADTLDGQQGSYYAAAGSLSNYLPLTGGNLTGDLNLQYSGSIYSRAIKFQGASASAYEIGIRANGEGLEIYEPEDVNKVWLTISDDPSGNASALQVNSAGGMTPVVTNYNKSSYITKTYIDGLNVDSDTLDGLTSTQFLRSDTSDTMSGTLTVDNDIIIKRGTVTYKQAYHSLYVGGDGLDDANTAIYIGNRGDGNGSGYELFYEGVGNDNKLKLISENFGGSSKVAFEVAADGDVTFPNNVVVEGSININAADLSIGAANIIFDTESTLAVRGLIWDVDGGFKSKIDGGGTNGGLVEIYTNLDGAITTGDVFRIKQGSSASTAFSMAGNGYVNIPNRLAIGKTTAPNAALDVIGGNNGSNLAEFKTTTNAVGASIMFSDHSASDYLQRGNISYYHADGVSYGSGNAFVIGGSETTTTILADGKLMFKEGIYLKPSSGTGAGIRKDVNWDNAYSYSQVGHLPLTGGTLTGNLLIDIADTGSSPAMTNTLRLKGYEGRGIGIKIQDSVNSATNPSAREWFIGSGYSQSGFNIGYAADGVQSSYTAQNKFSLSTGGDGLFAGNVSATGGIFTGNVGIGTTSPAGKLSVLLGETNLSTASAAATTGYPLSIRFTGTASDNNLIRHESSANPTGYYTLMGTRYDYNKSFVINNKGSEIITYSDSTGLGLGLNGGAGNLIIFTTNSSERMRIDSSGAVLIGNGVAKIDTATKLQVSASDSGITSVWANADDIVFENNNNFGITLATPNTGAATIAFADPEAVNEGFIQYVHGDDYMRFATNQLERMRIDASGNVGIGTDSPSKRLTVNSSTVNVGIKVISTDAGSTISFQDNTTNGDNVQVGAEGDDMYFLAGGGERMRITSSGDVIVEEYFRVSGNVNNPNTFDYSLQTRNALIAGFSGTNEAKLYLHRDDVTIDINNILGEINFSGQDGGSYVGASIKGIASSTWGSSNSAADLVFQTTSVGSTTPTERMRIDSSGNIIQTASGNPQFTISGSDGAYTGILKIQAAGGGGSKIQALGGTNSLAIETAGTERMRIDSGGSVLIGSSTVLDTAVLLQITGNSSGVTSFSGAADDVIIEHNTNVGITLATPNTALATIAFADPQSLSSGYLRYDHSDDHFEIAVNDSERMRIASNGNVGIGTASPLYKLQVQDRIHIQDTTIQQPKISFSENTNASGEFVLEYNGVGGGAGNYVSFYSEVGGWVTKGNGFNYIPENGRVGIGTTSPAAELHIYGAQPYIYITNTAENGAGIVFNDAQAPTGQAASIQFNSGNETLGFFVNDASAERVRIQTNGDTHFSGDVVAYSTSISDERLKDNIETIPNALDKVNLLRGVSYVWNEGSRKGQKDLGLIAQEVEKVLPEIVREKEMSLINDSGIAYKTIDYEKMVGVLIEAVKELSAEVEQLKAKL